MKYLSYIIFSFLPLSILAAPRVPATMDFAGMKLTINDAARRDIQKDVDALHRSQTYFMRKLAKVEMYFPIIERVFREQNLPEDFKYLVIQESALIADAVSSSNAVGFWQFKEMTAKEVGLRVDRQIDERMNITASSRGAAKYLKKNNFFFDNWIYALLAYNTGPGGAERHVQKKYFGAHKMTITKQTHWYVKKFLAHMVAFESMLGRAADSGMMLVEYEQTANKSLKDIAREFRIEYQLVSEYNKWLRKGTVPTDKTYTALLPVSPNDSYALSLLNPTEKEDIKVVQRPVILPQNNYKPVAEYNFEDNEKFPVIKTGFISKKIKINGIRGFIASSNDNLSTVTIEHGVTQKKFMKYNEMTAGDEIEEGQVYYLRSKKSKAKVHYHVVLPGETAWSISQKYGLKVRKLLEKNRMREEKNLDAGMVLWLRFIRPANVAVEYRNSDAKNLIVQSSPNTIDHSSYQSTKSIEQPVEQTKQELIENKENAADSDGGDFVFEEINTETDFIDENSYIDISKAEEAESYEEPGSSTAFGEEPSSEKTGKKIKKYHIVKSGETLFSISRMYDVSIGKIRQWNNINDLDVLYIGQNIIVYHEESLQANSAEKVSQSNFQTYTVKKNDTLYGIARANGLSIKELMDLNNKDDFNIQEGEILRIKKSK